jgi:hypothetical protein
MASVGSDNPFLDANQPIPYNFKLNDVTNTAMQLYFSSKLHVQSGSNQIESTSRKIVSFLELSDALLDLGDRCSDLSAEYVKQNYCILIGVGSGNVIKSKTGPKGIASLVVSNRVEILNYWHQHLLNEGDQLYLIIKQEEVVSNPNKRDRSEGSKTKHAWVLQPKVGLKDPTLEDLVFQDKNGIERLGTFIYVDRCNDRSPAQTDNKTHNKPENRASRFNDSMREKLCGAIEIFV